jgi:hypothetical protein
MRRTLFVCALLLTLPPYGRTADPPFQGGLAAPPGPAPTETVIRMKVRPAPAPKPALKYQLLPELREMNPGNPIQAYSLCFAEQQNFWHNKEAWEKRDKWEKMPLKELPLKEMRQSGYDEGKPLRYADDAARLDTLDWQILLPMKREGPKLLLPNLQQLRSLAFALKVRFRVEIAEHRFEDALATAKTMLAMSRHLGEHPTLIGYLVGSAVANLAIAGPLEEMIQQPGSPNLFWALTDLPSPFLDLRKARQGERILPDIDTELAGLDDRQPMTEIQLRKIVERVRALLELINGPGTVPEQTVREWLETRTKDKAHVRAARKRLAQALAPTDATKFESFPPLQIVLLDEKLTFEVRHDERMKALALPYWQAHTIFAAISRPKKEEMLFVSILSEVGKIKMTQARLDQRLGLLRCVEALRLYAAEHEDKLPAKLDDIKLPLPVDAVTGKPFIYELKGDTAIVRGTPPPGTEKILPYHVRYEVTIAK